MSDTIGSRSSSIAALDERAKKHDFVAISYIRDASDHEDATRSFQCTDARLDILLSINSQGLHSASRYSLHEEHLSQITLAG